MKKLLLLVLLSMFLLGCGLQRGPTWKNLGHFKYSVSGYKNPTVETGKMSDEQGWWGKEIPYVPAD